MKSAFSKGVLRSIKDSIGRFLAIAIIAALGTGFFAGLRMTAPDMRLAADDYFDATNLYDIKVMSNLGLSDAELNILSEIEGVDGVMGAWSQDVLAVVDGEQYAMSVRSLPDAARDSDTSSGWAARYEGEDYQNRPILVEGSWPKQPDECVVSADAVTDTKLSVGDTIKVIDGTSTLDDTLATRTFTITGFVHAPYYIEHVTMDMTSLGDGALEDFLYVPAQAFCKDAPYTEAYVSVAAAQGERVFTDAYQRKVDEVAHRIEDAKADLSASRVNSVRADAQTELDRGRKDYEEAHAKAEQKLSDGQAQLDDSKHMLDTTKGQLDSSKRKLDDAASTIKKNETNLAQGKASLEQGVQNLAARRRQADAQFSDAQAKIDQGRAAYQRLSSKRSELVSQRTEAQKALDALDTSDPEQAAQAEKLKQEIAQLDAAISGIDQQIQNSGISPEALQAAQGQLDAQRAQAESSFAAAQAQLDQTKRSLDAGERELNSAKKELKGGQKRYEDGKRQYLDGVDAYNRAAAEYEAGKRDAEDELADAKQQLDDAQKQIDDIKDPEWYVLDRDSNYGVASYESDADRMDQIAGVFPAIFFLVAALVSLTTMTRMVDEERVVIGTYKALGYSRARIASKYLIYVTVASGVGALVGLGVLTQFLPYFIMNAYGIMYAIPVCNTPLDPAISIVSVGMGVGVTLAATLLAVGATLRERPAALMLPRAPKAGKRIILERIRPLWSRMTFSWKVTARNIFRYKRRFFMAIVGIAGCTALLLTGLALRGSINDIINKQFENNGVFNYTLNVQLEEGSQPSQSMGLANVLGDSKLVYSYTFANTSNRIAATDGDDWRVVCVVPQDAKSFASYITMRNRISGDPVTLTDDGVVLSEKVADRLGVGVGDTFRLYDENEVGHRTGAGVELKVSGIMENYVNHYVYISPALYERVFGQRPEYNMIYAKTTSDAAAREKISKRLQGEQEVKLIQFNDEKVDTYRTMIRTVNSVVVVLVVAAAALAFVVLYNLTNINITERAREIATLKVLGFTPREVDAYIFRETLLLSVIGAVVGLGLGVILAQFVIQTAEVDAVMFGRDIHIASYVISFALTMVFSVIVEVAMKRKLKKIDMVESLKSVE